MIITIVSCLGRTTRQKTSTPTRFQGEQTKTMIKHKKNPLRYSSLKTIQNKLLSTIPFGLLTMTQDGLCKLCKVEKIKQ